MTRRRRTADGGGGAAAARRRRGGGRRRRRGGGRRRRRGGGAAAARRRRGGGGCVADENIISPKTYVSREYNDTENRLLKNFYANIAQNEKLQNSCTLLTMREQLSIFYEHMASWEM